MRRLRLSGANAAVGSVVGGQALVLPCLILVLFSHLLNGADRFDVISIKADLMSTPIRRHSPTRIYYQSIKMPELIEKAFGLPQYRIVYPDWVNVVRFRANNVKPDINAFTISATMSSSTTPEEFRRMLQNLLVDRFGLAFHRETRQMEQYQMTFVDGGPKMPIARPVAPPPPDYPDEENLAAAGRTHGVTHGADGMRLHGDMTLPKLADFLSQFLWHPIAAPPGASPEQYYVVDLWWFWSPLSLPPPVDGTGTNRATDSEVRGLFSEMEKKLGLKMALRSVPVGMVVIDHLNHEPTDN